MIQRWRLCFGMVALAALTSCCWQVRGSMASGYPPTAASPVSNLAIIKSYHPGRHSSADRAGNFDCYPLRGQETLTLASLKGPGEITHIWMTIASGDPRHLRNMVLRVYYDGNEFPSVETPVGDFFGLGHARYYTFGNLVQAIGTNNGMNSFWPMPFRKSARVTITNESDIDASAVYYYVDWRQLKRLPRDAGYFHAQYRQAFPCPDLKPYLILDTEGAPGQYMGVSLSIHTQVAGWWGEGDDIITLDGEKIPSLWGTGSEDYFSGAWCFGDTFAYAYFGMPYRERQDQSADNYWNVYRYHLENPIAFKRAIKVEIEHGASGFDNTRNGGRNNDYSSIVYWYMKKPVALKGALPPAAERSSKFRRVVNPPEIIEAQSCDRVTTPGKGVHLEEQGMSSYTTGLWLNHDQLFCDRNGPGSRVALTFETERDLEGPVVLHLTQAPDYARIRVTLDGAAIAPDVDLYYEKVRPAKLELDSIALPAGTHTLEIETLGRNEKSTNFLWGVDYMRIGGQAPPVETGTTRIDKEPAPASHP